MPALKKQYCEEVAGEIRGLVEEKQTIIYKEEKIICMITSKKESTFSLKRQPADMGNKTAK